jgi:hypothetical protein
MGPTEGSRLTAPPPAAFTVVTAQPREPVMLESPELLLTSAVVWAYRPPGKKARNIRIKAVKKALKKWKGFFTGRPLKYIFDSSVILPLIAVIQESGELFFKNNF